MSKVFHNLKRQIFRNTRDKQRIRSENANSPTVNKQFHNRIEWGKNEKKANYER